MGFLDMSAIKALNFIKHKTMLLPDIQREFVWEMSDIEKLFESIADGYPLGFCIFWKTTRKVLNEEQPNLYYFVTNFEHWKTKNEKGSDTYGEEADYYIVLDGQQRLTALNIALYGYYSEKKRGKGYLSSNPKSWVKRKLYYNLDFHKDSLNSNDENPIKRFLFLSDDEAKNGNYYLVSDLIRKKDDWELKDSLDLLNVDRESQKDLVRVFDRLNDETSNGVIHYYEINNASYDEALDIFVRVNSTGRKLSKSDLLFSTLIDNWKEGRESIDTLILSMNSKGDGFNFTRDYLMRLSLVLTGKDTKLKIEAFNRKARDEIKTSWKRIDKTCETLTDLLVSIGMSNENLTSYNATMPLAYYIFNGGKFDDEVSKNEARKFLAVSMTKGLFGVASDQSLTSTRKALQDYDCHKNPFTLDVFKNVVLTGGRTFTISETDIDYWLDNFEKGRMTYIILCLLYPNYKLSREAFHQDHCHPWVSFESKNIRSLGLSPEKEDEWRHKRNLLPNLQFLEGDENEHKNKTPLIDWVGEGNSIEYMPENISLKLSDFDDFFKERRKLIKNKLMDIFGLVYKN